MFQTSCQTSFSTPEQKTLHAVFLTEVTLQLHYAEEALLFEEALNNSTSDSDSKEWTTKPKGGGLRI